MSILKKPFCIAVLFLCIISSGYAQKLENQYDQLMMNEYPVNEPGATALVAVDGEIIYQKGFGMADLELGIANRPEIVFEIGSITKQFTAVSILMLMEQGKLSLDDDITKYIEDYPTHGYTITIHQLLTHTSGIRSYTSMEKWRGEWRKDFEPLQMIDFFKNEPMDFAPGEKYLYNNSAYFILGYIIEKVSGQTYAAFIENEIFNPLGMNTSYYGSHKEVIKNRAKGYQKEEEIVNAEYLSMTQPYSAGSIMSTVGDLFIWNRAIRSNKLVKKETIDLAFTNYTLNNGEEINYGYGWVLNDINGSQSIEHGGGIFGYTTYSTYLPDEDVFVAIFSNTDYNNPSVLAIKMAALAINKPYSSIADSIEMDIKDLESLIGIYEFEDGSSRIITLDNGQLYSQRTGGGKYRIFPVEGGVFWFEDSFANIQFHEKNGKTEAIFSNRNNQTSGFKTDKAIPEHNEIEVSMEILKRYLGVFELAPQFSISITLEDGNLMAQASGQENLPIFPESETKFFYKIVDAQIEFIKGDNQSFDSLILYQGGRETKGKKTSSTN